MPFTADPNLNRNGPVFETGKFSCRVFGVSKEIIMSKKSVLTFVLSASCVFALAFFVGYGQSSLADLSEMKATVATAGCCGPGHAAGAACPSSCEKDAQCDKCKCGECKCGECKCGECKCGECKCGECKCGECKCGECKCGECKCGECKCSECKCGECKCSECKCSECKCDKCPGKKAD